MKRALLGVVQLALVGCIVGGLALAGTGVAAYWRGKVAGTAAATAERNTHWQATVDKLQADAKGSYETNFGTVIATRRNPTTKVEVDMAKLLQEELTPEEEHALVIAAKGFDWKTVDPGLKDGKSGEKLKGWKPTTRLGEYALAAAEEKKDRSGFMLIELGRKYL